MFHKINKLIINNLELNSEKSLIFRVFETIVNKHYLIISWTSCWLVQQWHSCGKHCRGTRVNNFPSRSKFKLHLVFIEIYLYDWIVINKYFNKAARHEYEKTNLNIHHGLEINVKFWSKPFEKLYWIFKPVGVFCIVLCRNIIL